MSFLETLFRASVNKRALKILRETSDKVSACEGATQALSDTDLAGKTAEFKTRLSEGVSLETLLPEAFSVVRETAKRLLNERHHEVQVMGGVALFHNAVAEMRTGEGKTLVATLPTYLYALTEKGVHVVTVNDYLARRDAVWMGQIYHFLGLSVGVIHGDASYVYDPFHKNEGSPEDKERDETGSFKVVHEFLRPVSRREAYLADITYGTNNEFGFDYLRDNIEYEHNNIRQRPHHVAIIDEVDSILIDEARTPLIISAPAEAGNSLYERFAKMVVSFVEGEDYTKDEKLRAIQITDAGIAKAEKILGIENIYTDAGISYVHHLETAVRAKALFLRDTHYVVRDSEVIIVDEFTGRLQPGRRWSDGLHQAVEAKEGVPIQRESRTFASITFQNYFRMYEHLAGMTGTAETSAEEFYSVYKLDVVRIPTHKPVARRDHEDLVFISEKGKFTALVRTIQDLHKKGQPVLVGTASVERNEVFSTLLEKAGIPHAKNHEREGEIIAQAGRKGAVTIATNMAGRGVDIKLGGSPYEKEKGDEVRALGGLYVLGTERHEARRIDDQLRGRAGRQGDPGETQFFVSLDDHLMRVFGNNSAVRAVLGKATPSEDMPLTHRMITRSLETAQKRIEGFNFDARKRILAFDDVLNRQRQALYEKRKAFLAGDREALDAFLAECVSDAYDVSALYTEKKHTLGEEEVYEGVRRLLLQTIDFFWLEHLEMMEHLRSSVNLRAYGQRDPLVEYRKEGLRLYRDLEAGVRARVVEMLPRLTTHAFEQEQERMRKESEKAQKAVRGDMPQAPVHAEKTFGRNDMVSITNGKETRTLKYKKAEDFLKTGVWRVV
jgi:preprotein translocase subunit SecA